MTCRSPRGLPLPLPPCCLGEARRGQHPLVGPSQAAAAAEDEGGDGDEAAVELKEGEAPDSHSEWKLGQERGPLPRMGWGLGQTQM